MYNPEIKLNKFFFNIGGDAEQHVVFMVECGGDIIAQPSTILNHRSNSIIVTLAKPLQLNFVTLAGNVSVYPSPFNNMVNIAADLSRMVTSTEHHIQISIVDVSGRLVMQMPAKMVRAQVFKPHGTDEIRQVPLATKVCTL